MSLASTLLSMLKDMERVITNAPEERPTNDKLATRAIADYTVTSPKGSRSRFSNRGISLAQLPGNARTETAVLAYLKKQHPQAADVQLNNVSFT